MSASMEVSEGQLRITHILAAPRADAFTWWSQAEKLQQWSGCAGATRCSVTMDFRVGGRFDQTMQIAGCGDFSFYGVYEEIVVPERIVWRAHYGPVSSRVMVEFFEMGERTRVVLTQDGFPDERFLKNVSQGTLESFSALDAVLEGREKSQAKEVVL